MKESGINEKEWDVRENDEERSEYRCRWREAEGDSRWKCEDDRDKRRQRLVGGSGKGEGDKRRLRLSGELRIKEEADSKGVRRGEEGANRQTYTLNRIFYLKYI